MSRVAVVIPTVTGREDHYERCKASYLRETDDHEIEIFTIIDEPTLGLAWQSGVELIDLSKFDYLHLTCDDIVCEPGWLAPCIEAVEAGYVPAPYTMHAAGEYATFGHPPDSVGLVDWKPTQTTVSPFCKAEWWEKLGPMIPLHYYTDDWFSYKARLAGIETRCRLGFKLRHFHSMVKRGAGMSERDRLVYDSGFYSRVINGGAWPTREEATGC